MADNTMLGHEADPTEHMPDAMAKRVTSQWFHDVFGIWSGKRKGKNPTGRGRVEGESRA